MQESKYQSHLEACCWLLVTTLIMYTLLDLNGLGLESTLLIIVVVILARFLCLDYQLLGPVIGSFLFFIRS